MKQLQDYLTEFIFQEDVPEKADYIMIPGSEYGELSLKAAELYRQGYADKILVSGKYSRLISSFSGPVSPEEYIGRLFETEAQFHAAVMMEHGVAEEDIILEEKATFTYENALYLRKLLAECYDFSAERSYTVLLVCQAFHSKRSFLYFQYVFPNVKFLCCPAITQGITRDNWHLSEKGRKVVLGEVTRIGTQFQDILAGTDPVWKEILR